MKLCLIALATLSVFTACGGSSSDQSPTTNPSLKTRDTTNRSSCQGPVPAGASPIGRWKATSVADNQMNILLSLDIRDSYIVVQTFCSLNSGLTVAATVRSPILVTSNKIQILTADKDAQSSHDGSQQVSCSIDLPTSTLDYSFVGNCLQITFNGEPQTFVH